MVQFSKNSVKKQQQKNNERIDEVSDPLYFFQRSDFTLHKYMHFFFKNGLLQNKHFYCLFVIYPYIYKPC